MTKKEKEKLVLIHNVLAAAHKACAAGHGSVPFVPAEEDGDAPEQGVRGRAARYEAEVQALAARRG
jgi:hypothetical protein